MQTTKKLNNVYNNALMHLSEEPTIFSSKIDILLGSDAHQN